MPLDLDIREEFLRSRRNAKWTKFEKDILPSWIAEMDFLPPPAVQRAVEIVVSKQDYGYPKRASFPAETVVAESFARRVKRRFAWNIDAGLVQPVTDLLQATVAAILAFTEPGDGVLVQTPCYPPFREAVASAGRRLVESRLIDDGTKFGIDYDEFGKAADQARLFLLCNPQNPTGRVFTREELLRMARIVRERGMVIVSDEIHADLVYPGSVHLPIAALDEEAAAGTVTLNSAGKSFNIPGLRCGVMHFGRSALMARFRSRVPRLLLGKPSIIGIDATVAAWDECDRWLDEVLVHLGSMRGRVVDAVRSDLPGLKLHVPEATYLAWIDCSGLGWQDSAGQRFLERGGVAFSFGETFCPDYKSHIRFNFSTSAAILEAKLERMWKVVSSST